MLHLSITPAPDVVGPLRIRPGVWRVDALDVLWGEMTQRCVALKELPVTLTIEEQSEASGHILGTFHIIDEAISVVTKTPCQDDEAPKRVRFCCEAARCVEFLHSIMPPPYRGGKDESFEAMVENVRKVLRDSIFRYHHLLMPTLYSDTPHEVTLH